VIKLWALIISLIESTITLPKVRAIFRGMYFDSFLLNALVFQEVKVIVEGPCLWLRDSKGQCVAWVYFFAVK
jgi:hypothetical protein